MGEPEPGSESVEISAILAGLIKTKRAYIADG